MTTNKPNVKRYDDTGSGQICPINNMYESDDGIYVLYRDYKALQSDRDQQYDMKVKAREQRDAVTAKLNALQAECDALRDKTSTSLGVGNGAGNLFVHGDYDSVKRVQELIFECEKLRKDAERYRKLRSTTWDASPLCVVVDPKHSVQLGSDCPSHKRLDDIVDNLHVTTP